MELVLPSVGEIVSTSPVSNDSGSAPYFSTSARSLASFLVNDPEICALPSTIAVDDVGEDSTSPSRVMENSFGGLALLAITGDGGELVVPLLLNCRLISQPPPVVSSPASADLISVPRTAAGSSRYFAEPSRLHVTRYLDGP